MASERMFVSLFIFIVDPSVYVQLLYNLNYVLALRLARNIDIEGLLQFSTCQRLN